MSSIIQKLTFPNKNPQDNREKEGSDNVINFL